jgi:hypothetical protein
MPTQPSSSSKPCRTFASEAQGSLSRMGSWSPEARFRDGDTFGRLYWGSDRKGGRVFFGFLSLGRRERVPIYGRTMSKGLPLILRLTAATSGAL